ncbi:CDP-glycerol glycerophosphotransferase family protein [Methanobrevibacter filiformis]|uniref:CDP-glycerol:poly(Glycerophosphate) glycerophosphotransferase n=1 Tax=Methanobrevibacter filiformis TaxID=55758 RepID=A0A165ZK96_9EURY|nr:CDP-glycerol glycerophosphotransferase family protein [Methanobrevibacter filiformis]KZX10826.1 CDP-glycerol:poly(glycerophosphate) glycerophosphotransferase [Methanobrevibacter filiformis]
MSNIKKVIRKLVIFIYHLFFYLLQTKGNVIIFESGNGRNYTGNPKYIYEYIINNCNTENLKLIWSLEDVSEEIPGNPIKVRRTRLKYLYYSIISKFWIFDARHPEYLIKKDQCKYIQTWHGTPLKKLGLDMNIVNMGGKTDIEEYKQEFEKNTKILDYLISQNDYSSSIFKRAFNFKGKMLEIGYPRNDVLINDNNEENILNIKNKLNIPKNKKIILYAPTWRDNKFHSEGIYKFSTELDFDILKKELNQDYMIIVKYHYLVRENKDHYDSDFVIIADEKTDIQELYLISDILITDYSSVMFDYSLLKKPMIFYTYDLEFYKNNLRDFYFNIYEEAPGPILETNEEIVNYIKSFNTEEYFLKYQNKYSNFIKKYNSYDDGNVSKRIVENILQLK